MVKIIADSTCDLSQELIKKYDITLLPLHVLLGEKDCKDGKEVNAEDIYKWADENKTTPKTAAPSPQEVIDLFESFAKDDTEIICFSISGEMSGTYSVMKLAKEEVKNEEKIYVIDSRNLSTGIGLLVLEAATMAREGKTAKEIVEYLDTIKGKVRSSFVVDTLTYLHRGGRCSGVTAMAGNMMKLHPKIIVTDGKMEVGKKYRGSISKSLLKYVRDMEDELKNAKKDRVFITHSGCEQSVVDEIYKYLEGLQVFDEILITTAGCVISSHCGPGTLGVLYIKQ